VSFTDVNAHTKKDLSNRQGRIMGTFSVTTPDRSAIDLEKTFSLEGSRSVLNPEKKDKIDNKASFTEEIKTLKKIHKIEHVKNVQDSGGNVSGSKKENLKITENNEIVNVPAISSESAQLINALVHTQNHIVEELTEVFDKRLEKFDEIIMDLIRCKTENERLKQKVDNLTRDNYKLKKEVESFKTIIPGVYIRKELDKTKF